ncbi:MAG: caspase family protein [bacterium]|nr:caspase family protein [bacterium]
MMAERFDKGYALIIGVANYPHPNMSQLPEKVLKDARDVYDILLDTEYCAYLEDNTRKILDSEATAARIRAEMTWLADSAKEDNTAVIFFSGHGAQIRHGKAAGNYLLSYDCNPNPDRIQQSSIAGDEFTSLLQNIKAERVVVFFDSCHSGGVGETKSIDFDGGELKFGLKGSYYDKLAQGEGRVIIASSDVDELSRLLPGQDNSLFTHYLLEALKGQAGDQQDGLIHIFDLFKYLAGTVPEAARKQPIQIAPGVYDDSQNPEMKARAKNDFPIALYLGGAKSVGGIGHAGNAPTPNSAMFTQSALLEFLYQEYRHEPDEKVSTEKIQQRFDVQWENLRDTLLSLREKGFVKAKFVGKKALVEITPDGVALMK